MKHKTNWNRTESFSSQSIARPWVKYRVAGLYLSVLFVVMSLLGVWLKGINFGIDFTGGFITEYSTSEAVNQNEMKSLLDRKLSGPYILAAAENNTHWTVRQPEIAGENTAEQSQLVDLLKASIYQQQ